MITETVSSLPEIYSSIKNFSFFLKLFLNFISLLKNNNKSLFDLIITKPLLEPLLAGFRINFPNLILMLFKYFSSISFIFITSYLGVKILCLLIIFLDLILLKQLDDEL